jgi:hypothetical protein
MIMRTSRVILGLLAGGSLATASLALATGCSFDWDLPAIGAPEGASQEASFSDATDAGNASSDSASGDSDAGNGVGCTSNADCNKGSELCYFPDTSCKSPGVCVTVNLAAAICSPASPGPQVCACGDKLFGSTCAVAGEGLGLAAGCTQSANDYACGYESCPRATYLCEVSEAGTREECKSWSQLGCSTTHDCICASKSCGATAPVPGDRCKTIDDAGDLLLTCP